MGMASNDRLEDFLSRMATARSFHEMRIPLAIVATDLLKGESVHFRTGEIGPALRASCAYPGLFLPVEYRGHFLVDGFLTEQVPAPALREMGAEVIISVHLEPGLLDTKPRNTIEVISRSFSIIQVGSMQAWRNATDVLIEPDVHRVLWDEFVKTPDLVAAGQLAAGQECADVRSNRGAGHQSFGALQAGAGQFAGLGDLARGRASGRRSGGCDRRLSWQSDLGRHHR